jgi:iron(III) transport system substrate-binding protein
MILVKIQRRSLSRGLILLAIAGALALATGCGSPPSTPAAGSSSPTGLSALIAAAKQEGQVTYYGSLDPSQLNKVAAAFTKQYGIKVNVVRLASNALVQRFASEAQSGKGTADVFTQSDPDFAAMAASKGWTVKSLNSTVLPALASFPESAVSPGYIRVINFPYGFEYNTQAIAKAGIPAPTKWTDFTNPAYKGHLLAVTPTASKGDAGLEYYWDKTFGDKYLSALKANGVLQVDSLVTGVQRVAAGEAWACLITIPGNDATLLQNGAPIKAVFPDDTATGAHFLSISATAPHPSAARLFANFLLTEAGATTLVAGAGSSPLGATTGEGPAPAHGELVSTTAAGAAAPQLAALLGFAS